MLIGCLLFAPTSNSNYLGYITVIISLSVYKTFDEKSAKISGDNAGICKATSDQIASERLRDYD